jgi:crossover junction endodeoxyribonuclease RuvC
MNRCILGVDPRPSGAIAFYFTGYPTTVSVEDFPIADNQVDGATLAARIEIMRTDLAVIQRANPTPSGAGSTFRFGEATGIVVGVLAALKIPIVFVCPGRWKKHFGGRADAEKARAWALQLWPDRSELFARKKDQARAAAALIARWGAETTIAAGGETGARIDG